MCHDCSRPKIDLVIHASFVAQVRNMVKLDAALEAFIAGESVEYAWESEDKDTGMYSMYPVGAGCCRLLTQNISATIHSSQR